MDDMSVLVSRRNGKAVWMVEITDSRMNFFVNSKALSFLGLSSMQTGNRVRPHTEARPEADVYMCGVGALPESPPQSCCQERLLVAAQLEVVGCKLTSGRALECWHWAHLEAQRKGSGEQVDGTAILPEDAQGVGCSSHMHLSKSLFCFCFPGMIMVILLLLVAIVVVGVWPTG